MPFALRSNHQNNLSQFPRVVLIFLLMMLAGFISQTQGITQQVDLHVDVISTSVARDESSIPDYDKVLRLFVDTNGMVNYKALTEDRVALDRYIKTLAVLDPQIFESWSPPEKTAFWINAYNALTLQIIIDHYPITEGNLISGLRFPANSIRQISGAWDRLKFNIMGRKLTLNEIEHKVLRKSYDEPRIHMALVCASMGCPPLRNEPYSADHLDAQFEDQARRFMADPAKFQISREHGIVYISSIFKWFGSDFAKQYQTVEFQQSPVKMRAVLEFIARHVSEEDSQFLKTQAYRIEFLDYDWLLNEQ